MEPLSPMPHHAASYGEIISLWLRYGDYGFAMEVMAMTER
jgi:hypothetical protein